MKRYLVTGGSGFLGAALVKRLVKEGHAVKTLDNNSRGSFGKLGDVINDVEFFEGDIRDTEMVIKASKNVDSIVHMAFINGTEFFYSKPYEVLDVGIRGMLAVLDACKTNGIGELVLASSSEAYQTPPTVPTPEEVPLTVPDVLNPRYSYGGGKLISELLTVNFARTELERALIFRPHNVYGSDMGWEHVLPQLILRAKKSVGKIPEGPIPFEIQGDGKQTRAFVHIDDFTDGLMTMINHGNHMNVYHIGNPEEITIADVAKQVVNYFGREIELITSENPAGATLRRCPDISKLAKLGYTPSITFSDGLPSIASWYSKNADLHPN